ncbi:MAG: hypothetical protein KME49_16760 [Brasilonema octagenarum HA4186-MV1]|jgi:hypothetical protein|uniref:Uncharacterized protein n=1 Tax=Brasilonema octagenarum UFV-OR1 TaxID=417115 RepID=A0ABX1MDZ4_9CYAN|nr:MULTISPECIES: hypothetical protein [Brasilonema]MBP5972211.1 hypothetical protein [Brasilonema sp. CT11]MBW4627106.1 hypothetical protein [Brasilonema octagenarum HA4186-MV1]NMF66863.1 hypothetical protein [Brasilonema octagenarum UFV-OR1]
MTSDQFIRRVCVTTGLYNASQLFGYSTALLIASPLYKFVFVFFILALTLCLWYKCLIDYMNNDSTQGEYIFRYSLPIIAILGVMLGTFVS